MTSGATLRELGNSLQKLTDVKADTLRLIVRSNKSSKLLSPFSDEHSCLKLQETSIFEARLQAKQVIDRDKKRQYKGLQHDAACRVIARLKKERDEARSLLAQAEREIPMSATAMTVNASALSAPSFTCFAQG